MARGPLDRRYLLNDIHSARLVIASLMILVGSATALAWDRPALWVAVPLAQLVTFDAVHRLRSRSHSRLAPALLDLSAVAIGCTVAGVAPPVTFLLLAGVVGLAWIDSNTRQRLVLVLVTGAWMTLAIRLASIWDPAPYADEETIFLVVVGLVLFIWPAVIFASPLRAWFRHRLGWIDRALDAEDRFRRLVAELPAGVYRVAGDGTMLDANHALVGMLGFPDREALIGINVSELVPDPKQRREFFYLLMEHGEARHVERRHRRNDHSEVWLLHSAVAELDADGRLVAFDGIAEDITHTKQAEARAHELAADLDHQLRSQRALAFIARILHLENGDRPLETALARLAAATGASGAWLARVVDGERLRLASGSANPFSKEAPSWEGHTPTEFAVAVGDGPAGVLGLEMEVGAPPPDELLCTAVAEMLGGFLERADARAGLRAQIKSKDEFLASVSHELRTPLTAVIGFSEAISEGGLGPEETQELIRVLASEAKEMAAIIEDLLVGARTDSSELIIAPEAISVGRAVKAVADGLGIALSYAEEGPGDAEAWADPIRLRQIVRNLLTNAQRHGGERVRVVVTPRDPAVIIEVRDDGTGVPLGERERIFEPYQRNTQGRTLPSSVGLGLTVSRRLTVLMGGELAYRHDGFESIFCLTLPRAPDRSPQLAGALPIPAEALP